MYLQSSDESLHFANSFTCQPINNRELVNDISCDNLLSNLSKIN